MRRCFREPIDEIMHAAELLDAAATAYASHQHAKAAASIRAADIPAIREWTESIWGKNSAYVHYREPSNPQTGLSISRDALRMPSSSEKKQLHLRDGYHCRFCGIPVIRKEVRQKLHRAFPQALLWGKSNQTQHAAFQAMWAQYDHILPHAKGGTNELDNLVITCAPCNFGRMSYTLEEVGLADPRQYPPPSSSWDGLEKVLLVGTL